MLRRSLAIASIAVLCAGTASAATVKYEATLSPSSEVPPTTSKGSGMATVTLNTSTHRITYNVTFSGFASAATAAHIHGPAPEGKNAGVVVPLAKKSPTSPIHGTAKLTETQQKEMTSGMYYVNVHTKNNPGGAIRGQLMEAK